MLMNKTLIAFSLLLLACSNSSRGAYRLTEVSITNDSFYINGAPTYPGRVWKGFSIQGLLMNSRMVQGTFDDLNPATRPAWAYADTGKWDADRNTREFIAAMPEWKRHGLLSFTVNFQGGSPQGYSQAQPWENSAFTPEGELRADYCRRMKAILDEADRLEMAPMVGYFYFGQTDRFKDEASIIRATDNATRWLVAGGWRNVLVEVNNESGKRYPPILRPDRVHELIVRVRENSGRQGRRLLAGTSFGGGVIPSTNVVAVSDFILIHGNGVKDPARISQMVRQVRSLPWYRPAPILFNEDDHFDFEKPANNLVAAVSQRASWGFFDYRMKDEGFHDGYQSVPVDWGVNSERKRGFFKLCSEITGTKGALTKEDRKNTALPRNP